ncbi:MAG: hypothetical protein NC321_13585 [Clostridium sp.]|nr:hypothetical protein [Clostridium sp.]
MNQKRIWNVPIARIGMTAAVLLALILVRTAAIRCSIKTELKPIPISAGVCLEEVQMPAPDYRHTYVLHFFPDEEKEDKAAMEKAAGAAAGHAVVTGVKRYEDDILAEAAKYDEAGREIETIYYFNDGSIDEWFENRYDSMGNHILHRRRESNGDIWYQNEYEYDNNGRIVRSIAESELLCREYKYDEMGNMVKQTSYQLDGSLYMWSEFIYNELGYQIKSIRYFADGSIYDMDEYEYDESGNIINQVSYDGNGSISYMNEYEYDKAGNCTKQIHYNESGIVGYWTEGEWNEAGKITKSTEGEILGEVLRQSEYTYDEMGNKIKYIFYNQGIMVKWEEYEYDEKGNKIKQISYHEDGSIEKWTEWEESAAKKSVTFYKADGSIDYRKEYIYDKMGYLVMEKQLLCAESYSIAILGEVFELKTMKTSDITEYEYEYAYN